MLKVAPAFITNLEHQPHYAAIIQSVITLAHSLDMRVIGEGIESESELAQLQALDCDMGQGFYLSGSVGPDQVRNLLTAQPRAFRRRSA